MLVQQEDYYDKNNIVIKSSGIIFHIVTMKNKRLLMFYTDKF